MLSEPAEQEESDSFRRFYDKAKLDCQNIKDRLVGNERRLSALENSSDPIDSSWSDTLQRADILIAAVAAIEIPLKAISLGTNNSASHLSDEVERAINRFPNLDVEDLERLKGASTTSRMGVINLLQGHTGEQITFDLINDGRIPVPDGYSAEIATETNNPGYDLTLVSNHGESMYAQVKFSESGSIIRDHIARYPKINIIYANSEAASYVAHDAGVTVIHPGDKFPEHFETLVVDTGVSHSDVRTAALNALDNSGDLTHHGDQIGAILEKIPWIAVMTTAWHAAGQYLDSDSDLSDREILNLAVKRLKQTLIPSGIGQGAVAISNEPVSATFGSLYILGMNSIRLARSNIQLSTTKAKSARVFLTALCPLPT